jgi:peptidylprolyl isomerase
MEPFAEMSHMRPIAPLAGLIWVGLLACSNTAGPSNPKIEETTFAPSLNVDLSAMTKTGSGLYYRDLVIGAGALILVNDEVSAHYTGWLPNGTQFYHNGPSDTPYKFTVGAGRVIAGWDQGVVGMRVGGVRQLVIPPALGYGSQATGPIPANSILVFSVQIVSAQ